MKKSVAAECSTVTQQSADEDALLNASCGCVALQSVVSAAGEESVETLMEPTLAVTLKTTSDLVVNLHNVRPRA